MLTVIVPDLLAVCWREKLLLLCTVTALYRVEKKRVQKSEIFQIH